METLVKALTNVRYVIPDDIWADSGDDFLDEFQMPEGVKSIVMRPQGVENDFVRQGLSFFDGDLEFMAMLLRSEFKSGKTRADMFGDCPHYMGELVLTEKVTRYNFSWFLWHKNYRLQNTEATWLTPSLQIFSYKSKETKA